MMSNWKKYIIFCFGEYAGSETARSKKEACDLYVEKCKEKYMEDFGSELSDDMVEDVCENIDIFEPVDFDDDSDLYDFK